MAFLDGEVSAADAQAISTHLDHCAECTGVAEQCRSTSRSLSRWSVPAVPAKLEHSVTDLAVKTRPGLKTGTPCRFVRTSFWTWKHWAVGLGSATTAILVLLIVMTPNLFVSRKSVDYARDNVGQRSEQIQRGRSGTPNGKPLQISPSKLPREGETRGLDNLAGQPVTDQESKVFSDKIVTLASPGVAADSNGFFHWLGDHAESSFSVTSGPMIARTVSLSIVVKDFGASRSSLDAILARHHGYSAQLSVATPENAPRSIQVSLRIPATELSSAVADIKTLGRVENESQSGEEVTQQHTDLVARLKNSRETEQRFRAILQQRTGNVVDVLQVEEGIARVRGDIERMEAEQKTLEHRVDLTAVEL
jgi:hypothetical protein